MSSTAGMIAETFTVCMDTAKVRLQLQKVEPGQPPKYHNVFQTVYRMAADEGPRALFYGLPPGLTRQCLFNGIGNGLYVPIRSYICGPLAPGQYATPG